MKLKKQIYIYRSGLKVSNLKAGLPMGKRHEATKKSYPRGISLFVLILAATFLSGCGRGSPDRVATDPTTQIPQKEMVHLKESFTNGFVSSIDFKVLLPSGTKQSLLTYNGQASIQGTIQMEPTLVPCLGSGSHSFNCEVQLSSRSITPKNCAIGHGINILRIDIGSALELKTTYSIIGIEVTKIPGTCFYPTST